MAITAQAVKLHRQQLNKIEKGLDKLHPSREVSLAKTSLQESIMFNGLTLGDIGEENPYPKSSDASSPVIEDRADTNESDYNFDATDYVGMVKELRSEIEERIVVIKDIYKNATGGDFKPENSFMAATHIVTSITSLEKAKMWLGMALNQYKLACEKNAALAKEKADLAEDKRAISKGE